MIRIRQILVPFDFSKQSEAAFRYAVEFAQRCGADVVHVLHAHILHQAPLVPDVTPDGREAYLLKKLETVVPDSAVPIRGAVLRDVRVPAALLRYIEDQTIDLVVMGTHGRRGIRHMLLGSTAEEMVQVSPCPVVTVRSNGDLGDLPSPRTILVPVDFSDNSRTSLSYAKSLAEKFDASLKVVHVLQDTYYPTFYSPLIKSIYELDPDIEEKIRIKLNEFVLTTLGPRVPFASLVGYGHPVDQINEAVKESGADLIVMSTHGLTNVEHFLMGSVAEKVVRQAICPVFTIKSFGKSLLVDDEQNAS